MKKNLFVFSIVIFTLNLVVLAQSDIRIKKTTRMDFEGMPTGMKNPQTGEIMDYGKLPPTVVLIKGPRMLTETRHEQKGPTGTMKTIMSHLRQCDLGRELSYNNRSKTYQATYFSTSSNRTVKDQPVEKAGGGTLTFTMSYTDTGERQQMFGYTARRVKSVMTTTPSKDACQKTPMKIETDAWVIDLPKFSCPMLSAPPEAPTDDAHGKRSCSDKIVYVVVGKPDNGFAVKETMTMTMEGNPPMKMTSEVTEITKTDLDAQLFDVPPGYTESKESAKERPSQSSQNDTYSIPATANEAATPSFPGQSIATNPDVLQPKKKGVIRIGIAKPVITMPISKDDHTAPLQLSAAVRDSLVDSLKGETVEAIRLSTDTPESEAKQKDCDYIFYANVTQKRGGGGMFKKMVLMALSVWREQWFPASAA